MSPTDQITISHNYWRIPSVKRAFDGWLEGKPSAEDRRRVTEEAIAARKAWKPGKEALQLVEDLKSYVGCRIRLQFWDSIMNMLEEEGPYPLEADCRGVVLRQEGEFQQAYIELTNIKEIPTEEGYSPEAYFEKQADSQVLLAPLADLYQISKVGV